VEADLFVSLGAIVVAADIDFDMVRERVSEFGTSASALALDVSREDDWRAAVDIILERHGRIDVLVNNAGIAEKFPFLDYPSDHFRRVIEVNQLGPVFGMQAVGRVMASAGRGAIVNICSTTSIRATTMYSAYSASKAALLSLTKVAAMELGPLGVRVNAVLPGGVNTDMTVGAGAEPAFYRTLPLGRMGTPSDVAAAAAFLASDAAPYCTGTEILVDGGWTADFHPVAD
jgi:3alpha(or 20beta)-hydroxysteroid dehydrogenase